MKYLIEDNGQKIELTVRRRNFFKPKEIWLGTEFVGKWPNLIELNSGKTFLLKNGSKIEIKMENVLFFPQLKMLFNGEHIKGSAGHPEIQVFQAYLLLGFITLLNLTIGSAAALGNVETLKQIGYGYYNIIFGIIYLLLFAIGFKKRQFLPLAVGFGMFLIDAIVMINQLFALKQVQVGPIMLRIFCIVAWSRGLSASRERNKYFQ